MSETILSATKISHVHTFSKTEGFFLVTSSRVVFAKKPDLTSGQHWSYGLSDVQSVELKDALGGHDLVLHVRGSKVTLRQGIFGGRHDNMQALASMIMQRKVDLLNAGAALAQRGPATSSGGLTAELERLGAMRGQGMLSEDEFQQAKARLLRG